MVVGYKTDFKEMYFIRSGMVELFNNENDELVKDMIILYLP